jgi:hypothetical protein
MMRIRAGDPSPAGSGLTAGAAAAVRCGAELAEQAASAAQTVKAAPYLQTRFHAIPDANFSTKSVTCAYLHITPKIT